MTAGEPRPQEHCGHECVCDDFHPEYDPDYQEVCNNKDCPHDTRSHSSPAAAPVPDAPGCEGCACRIPGGCEAYNNGLYIGQQQAAEAAEAARREVLDKIIDQLLSDKSGMETNRDLEGNFWRSTGLDVKINVYENILKYIESLRSGKGAQRR